MEKMVYLLEDDTCICDLVEMGLELTDIKVVCFNKIKDFNAAMIKATPKIALLDIMLPDGNGFEVLSEIKQKYPAVTCIILSALGRENDKVRCLNLGADDYITKPFSVLELSARLNVAFRRLGEAHILAAGNVRINEQAMTVSIDGKSAALNNMEFKLLAFLTRHAGKVFTRDKLLSAVWGYEEGETRTVDNHISRLRRLGVKTIETVFGAGYKLR